MIEKLRERLAEVEDRLETACRRAGRKRADVTLVAVTKTVSAEIAAQLPELEVFDLAESRPQALWMRAPLLPTSVRWHLIGHLQRNKIDKTLPLVHMIHSVDSLRLLEALEQEASRQQRQISVLLEVNVSGETQKHGMRPEEVSSLSEPARNLKWVQIHGLMTMAAQETHPERCRPTFAGLRKLSELFKPHFAAPHCLEHLSMGMSSDFEVAVEEGATMVRLGSILFEGIT